MKFFKKCLLLVFIISLTFSHVLAVDRPLSENIVVTAVTDKIRPSLAALLSTMRDADKISVIVRYDKQPGFELIQNLKTKGDFERELPLIKGASVLLSKASIYQLAQDGLVTYLERNEPLTVALDYSTTQIQSKKVISELGITGQGVKVAVLDTGVFADHVGIKGSLVTEKDFTGQGGGDENGHGTHVANIISGSDPKYQGNAPDTLLYSAKVMKKDGSGDMSTAIAGLSWALEQKVAVANLSVGGLIANCDGTDALTVAVDNAVDQGLFVVVAAGNNGPVKGTINTPGCSKKGFTVGAVNDFNDVVYFSSRGPTTDGRIKPDILAPGNEIISAYKDGSWQALSGTSQATPHVAAAVALLKQINPALTPAEIKKVLLKTADPLTQNYVNTQDQPVINAYQAVVEAQKTTTNAPVSSAPANSDQNQPNNQSDNNQPDNNQTDNSTNPGAQATSGQTAEPSPSTADSGVSQTNSDQPSQPTSQPKTMSEVRTELKSCLQNAGSNEVTKSNCLATFLKDQRSIQYQALASSEQTNAENLLTALQKLATSLSANTTISADQKNQITALIEVLTPFLFVENWADTMAKAATDLSATLAASQDITESLNNFQSAATLGKASSLDLKYQRKLNPFIDDDDTEWFFSYIGDIKNKGCVSGYKDANGQDTGYFGPGNNLTVAESLRVLLECSEIEISSSSTQPKTLKARGHWAEKYYVTAEQKGLSITSNSGDDPNRPITRAEFIQEALQTFGLAPLTEFTAIFSDVSASSPYAPWIYKAYDLKIIAGDANSNTFRPTSYLNRAEMSKVVVETLAKP